MSQNDEPFAEHASRLLEWACKAWPVRDIGPVAYDDPSTTAPTLIVTCGCRKLVRRGDLRVRVGVSGAVSTLR